jgi:type I restriction enzyme S subunit
VQPIDLNPHDLDIVRAILQKFVPDREVWAFGSRVKWTAKPFSDLDLAIVGDQSLPVNVVADLAEAFDESELPIKVDVVDWATTGESFRKIIQKDKVVVQEKNNGGAVSPVPTFSLKKNGQVPAEIVELGTVCSVGDGAHAKVERCAKSETSVLYLTSKNIGDGQLILEDIDYISVNDYERLFPMKSRATRRPQSGDVLVGIIGTFGNSYLYKDSDLFGISSSVAVIRPSQKILSSEFLQYVVRSPQFKISHSASKSGSAQGYTNIPTIKTLPVPLLPISQQMSIVKTLSALDKKIQVCGCQRKTLNAIAKSLFQSWFVDFDPVLAKTEGRSPFGMDVRAAELFPSGFGDSDLGEIPAGWTATTLADIVTERTGKVGNGTEHVVLSAVASGELKRSSEHFTKQVHSQDTSKYKRVEQWDYAYNPSRINIGSIGMLEEPIVGAVSPVYTVLRPAQGYEWFLRFFLDLPQTKEAINQFCSGSVRQSLSFKDFAAIPVVLPPKEIAEAFARRWQELNALRHHLEIESNKLAEVRDTLLPKLMSGELRVPDELMA